MQPDHVRVRVELPSISSGRGQKMGEMPNSASTNAPAGDKDKIRYPDVHIQMPGQNVPRPSSASQNSTPGSEIPTAPQNPQAMNDEEQEGLLSRFAKGKLDKFDSETNLLLAVSALIITLSFAAVLQPPGGIKTAGDGVGEANLLGESKSFWVFFIANGTAMAAASSAVLLLVSCPPRKDIQAFVIIMVGKFLVWIAIQCSLIAFCASVWIIVGKEKYKVVPFFIAAVVLLLCFTTFFMCGRIIRATARKAKIKIKNVRHARRVSGKTSYLKLRPTV